MDENHGSPNRKVRRSIIGQNSGEKKVTDEIYLTNLLKQLGK